MIDYKKFEEKVKSMSAYEIIMSMVEGLRNPKTEIDMGTFGEIRDGVCFGCAATNAILNIMDVGTEQEVVDHIFGRRSRDYKGSTLWQFENAIDQLRQGGVGCYNEYAREFGFVQITPIPGEKLPRLSNNYTEEQLQEYVKLAKYQSNNYQKASKIKIRKLKRIFRLKLWFN